jgi:hypothetical protein
LRLGLDIGEQARIVKLPLEGPASAP